MILFTSLCLFLSAIWSLITHKSNVYVICPKGAGHFKHPIEAIRALRKSGKLSDRVGCSLIIRYFEKRSWFDCELRTIIDNLTSLTVIHAPPFCRPGKYNLDVDQLAQDDSEETAGTEENFIALSRSKSESKISAAIILRRG